LAGIEYLKTLPYVTPRACTTAVVRRLHDPLRPDPCARRLPLRVAGGRAHDWSYYDTIYTERYMRTPQTNPDGYAATNLIEKARKSRRGPL